MVCTVVSSFIVCFFFLIHCWLKTLQKSCLCLWNLEPEQVCFQDYAVGTSDLCNVTFRCVQCAGEVLNEGTNTQIDDFLPSIQGTLNAPIIM